MVKRIPEAGKARTQSFMQFLSRENNAIRFTLNNRQVKVIFSDKADTPTVEEALVKIAKKRENRNA